MPDRVQSLREVDSCKNRLRARLGFVKPIRNGLGKIKKKQNGVRFFFAIFIFYSRESELYCYILDRISELAWELPFPRCLVHLSST